VKVRYVVLSLALAGCGGKKGTIELDIVFSATSNPLGFGDKIEIIAGPHSGETTVGGTMDKPTYSLSFSESPPKSAYNLVMQVLDGSNNIVAYGETPLITLNPVDQGPFGVWLGVPGTVAPQSAKLDMGPATMMAGCNVNGLGGVLAGGYTTGTSGGPNVPTTTTYVYDVFTSNIIDTAALTTARAGAVAIGATGKGVVFGGTSDTPPSLKSIASAEAFDPTSGGAGQWVTFATTGMPGATAFGSITLANGSGLVTGGYDQNGSLTASSSLVQVGSTLGVSANSAPLNGPRAHHASAPIGTGTSSAIVIGGLADGDTMHSIVELYNGTAFINASAPGLPNLWYATATPVNGSVFVFGGTVGSTGMATNGAYLISQSATSNAVTVMPVLTGADAIQARARHTATVVGNDILLCGGVDEAGTAQGSCDVISTSPMIAASAHIETFRARQNHVAIPLETGPVILVGGDDATAGTTGAPLSWIDVYTPTMAEETVINQQNNAVIGTATPDGGT